MCVCDDGKYINYTSYHTPIYVIYIVYTLIMHVHVPDHWYGYAHC